MRIRVCDDVEEMADSWIAEIRDVLSGEFDLERMPDAKGEVSKLLGRKIALEAGKPFLETASAFDEIDVLVVDYDLLHLDNTGSRTTGEGVARLVRSLSNCGVIVVMNQFQGPEFDLGMRGHLESYADLNIAARLVGESALWSDVYPDGSFNPTTWQSLPALLKSVCNLKGQLAQEGLNAAILPRVGLDEQALERISDTAYGFLSTDAATAADLAKLTVREFLHRFLDADVLKRLEADAPDILFGLAAHRLVKWLERAVLRPMDVLIDTGHLVERLPFIIDASQFDLADPAAWTKAASEPEKALAWEMLTPFHNRRASDALGRHVFDWYKLSSDESFDELQEAFLDKGLSRFAFAEDTGRFVSQDAATRYRADFHNFGDRRSIERLSGYSYGPQRRLQFG